MTSKYITELVKNYFGEDFTKKSRVREHVYMRSVNNALCRQHTTESLMKIGSNYESSDHATVLHSIKMFNDVYKYQTDPIDTVKAYEDIEAEIIDDKKIGFVKASEQRDKIGYLILENRRINTELRDKIKELEDYKLNSIDSDGRFKGIFKDLLTMSDDELSEFHETRLKPFKIALDSRVKPKVIEKVTGAFITNRKIKNHENNLDYRN